MNPYPVVATALVAIAQLTPSASAATPQALGPGASLQGFQGRAVTAVASLPRASDATPAGRATTAPKPRPHRQIRPARPVQTPTDPKAYARSRLSGVQYDCLVTLWNRESGWNPRDLNASSGAYGIPQALPGSRMASAGADWRTNPITPVRWGLSYIGARYGTPCAALSHSYRFNWY